MIDRGFIAQLQGYRPTTAEIHFYRPHAPSLLLFEFLDHWRRKIEAALHSARVAHDRPIRPAERRAIDGVIPLP